jgi:hypothetical protein
MPKEHFPDLMGMSEVREQLGNLSRQRVDEIIRKRNVPYKMTKAGKIFLASDILKLKQELARHPRAKMRGKK